MSRLRSLTGPIYPVIVFSVLALCVLSFSRLALNVWQAEHITSIEDWQYIMAQGIRVDIATVCWLYILPAIFTLLLPTQGKFRSYGLIFLRAWLVLGLWFLVYMELSTPSFIEEYNLRPNRLFIEYLIYPKEVFSMLWVGYKLELMVGLGGSVLTIFWGWRLSKSVTDKLLYPASYWRPVLILIIIVLGGMGARSTLQHRPLNPALVAFSTNPLLNDLVLNSSYSVMFAAKNLTAEKSAAKFYGDLPLNDVIHQVRTYSQRKDSYISGDIPTLNINEPRFSKKKNLVILLQESLGARFVGALGGLPLTPNLDQLMTEGWNFTQLYATGTRSVRGIEAITTGFPPSPSRAVVKLSKSQSGFFTIAELLASQGYHTQFIYGGESHFDNMKSFFLGNGFQDIVDLPHFKNPKFVGSWGASDQDLYQMAHTQFLRLSKENKPFFSLVFTSTNHTPFEFPDGQIDLYEQPMHTSHNAIKYSDKALGEFFVRAKSSEYWKDTIFIVIADHDSRATGNVPVPVSRFHIPALILGSDIEPKKDQRLASNIDMPPTLLSLIGIKSVSPMIGHDMTKYVAPEKQRAIMQFDKNFGYLTKEKLVVLQPEKDPIAYVYDFNNKELISSTATPNEVKRALAHALLGEKLYLNELYKMALDHHIE